MRSKAVLSEKGYFLRGGVVIQEVIKERGMKIMESVGNIALREQGGYL